MPEGPSLPPARRHTGWKIFGLVVLVLVVFLIVTWVWMAMVADRRLMTLIQKVQRRVDELQARDGKRPVLRGEAQPGNAWDDYTRARTALKQVKGADSLWKYLQKDNAGDPAEGERLVAEHGALLDHLRLGASRGACRSYDWGQSMEGDLMQRSGYSITSISSTVSLAEFAQLKARTLLKEGHVKETVELLLDLCQFGRDVAGEAGFSHEALGRSYMAIAWSDIRTVLASEKASRAEFDLVDRALATLDQSFPRYDETLEQEVLTRAIESIPICESGIALGRLLTLDYVERQMEWAARAAKSELGNWAGVQAAAREISEEGERSWNPLLKTAGNTLVMNADQHRATRVRLRLLRIEVHWRATGEILDLEDPFGTKLKNVVDGSKLKAWSVGRDGVDDGGAGSGVGQDIVVEITR